MSKPSYPGLFLPPHADVASSGAKDDGLDWISGAATGSRKRDVRYLAPSLVWFADSLHNFACIGLLDVPNNNIAIVS